MYSYEFLYNYFYRLENCHVYPKSLAHLCTTLYLNRTIIEVILDYNSLKTTNDGIELNKDLGYCLMNNMDAIPEYLHPYLISTEIPQLILPNNINIFNNIPVRKISFQKNDINKKNLSLFCYLFTLQGLSANICHLLDLDLSCCNLGPDMGDDESLHFLSFLPICKLSLRGNKLKSSHCEVRIIFI